MLARLPLLALLSLLPLHAAAPLRVLRATPTGEASPGSAIAVTFDRPVAGSLDRTVDPRAVLRIEPAAEGTIAWRDPVTVVFTPTERLRAGVRYTVTVSDTVRAMDGRTLESPFRFAFRVHGPQLVTGSPIDAESAPRWLGARPRLELVWSAPVTLARLSGAVYLEMDRLCRGGGVVRLRAVGQRPVRERDPWSYRAPRVERDTVIPPDSLRRVVELVPESPLPLGCPGTLVAPRELDVPGSAPLARWRFSTYGPLRLDTLRCGDPRDCPTGPLLVRFSTPVRGAEVLRRVKIVPSTPFAVHDTSDARAEWALDATLKPRTVYAVTVDTAIRDIFGQPLTGTVAAATRTTGYAPAIDYPFGRLTVERAGFGTLAVRHVNVDTLLVTAAPVPDSLEGAFLRRSPWSWRELWTAVRPGAVVRRIPVRRAEDRFLVTGVKMPASAPTRGRTLWAVRVTRVRPDTLEQRGAEIALVQVTDLGVHAKIGAESGVVWVTGASDGTPRAGAGVTLLDHAGRPVARATTDAEGLARLGGYGDRGAEEGEAESWGGSFAGYVEVTQGGDRALVGISDYDPDLSPWRFDIRSAWGGDRFEAAAALFTERGIYRPGETVHAKAIVRRGRLGALAPPRGDSVRWRFTDRDGGVMRDSVSALSPFGTADLALAVPAEAPLGSYAATVAVRRAGQWQDIAYTSWRVAEYRPPEFLVDLALAEGARLPGDTVRASVAARYLFGAPMGRAQLTWQARQATLSPWELELPGTEGWFVGESGWWWEEEGERFGDVEVFASGVDTLDAAGRATVRVAAPEPRKGRAARVTVAGTVADVNRQVVGASASVVVHPADFYLAARPTGRFFWEAGKTQGIEVVAVRPSGERVSGVRVRGTVVRREWHQVLRERDGATETVGEWVMDTVARCTLTTGAEAIPCAVTPPAGGTYFATFTARDARGREARTALYRWATGREWVPWNDESRFRMDVVPERTRYTVGDTATVLVASPFTDAEAWVTVEREGVIEQRRLRLTSGSTTLRFPITEAWVPNAFVSVFVARGRSAPPGRLDDPGRPTIRVGYAELRVTPDVKRLAVDVQPASDEYRPGDTARVRLRVRDGAGRGQRAEVTLWAVDEGVLALTGYRTPDPIDLLYQARGLGVRLASNLASVAPQIPEGEKGREPGGGGGRDGSDILRSRFKTTAFFLGSVVTGEDGTATASAKLPDNLTTFRVMAVAVTAGDRYGSGDAKLLVTRPLVVRASLPRFVRPGDSLLAGAVVNQRAGGTPRVRAEARASGIELLGDRRRTATLAAGRGAELRWPFRARPGDSATVRFSVSGNGDADAVQARIPIRPDFVPRAHTIAGIVRDSATATFTLPADIDPERSRLELSLGASPLSVIRGVHGDLRVYPYFCTEQVASAATPLIALWRAQRETGAAVAPPTARADLELAVRMIARRQRGDGGIGYWSALDWTTPWLTAYAGGVLLDAREAGVAVDDSVLARLGAFLRRELNDPTAQLAAVARWYEDNRTRLSDRVAAVELLRRLGTPDLAAENQLVATAPQMAWEDRVRMASLMAERGERQAARRLLSAAWAQVAVEGRRAVLQDRLVRRDFLFDSRLRPLALLLRATLAVEPEHALVGPMVETLVQQARAQGGWIPNTQDLAATVRALAEFDRAQRGRGPVAVAVSGNGRLLLAAEPGAAARDSSTRLTGLLGPAAGEARPLRLTITARGGGAAYYYLTVREVPRVRPVTPSEAGIAVERWYERYDARTPIVGAAEGELVRVRLRITVPEDRQFVVLDDALPAGLEAVDLSLRTVAATPGPGQGMQLLEEESPDDRSLTRWGYGSWDAGWWSPFDHKEIRDDRVVYFATVLWKGTYTVSYIARATTPGVFIRPPARAEEMYNPGVNGRSDGGVFTVTERK